MQLQGRTVLVTGAGRGIGRSITLACAAEGAALALAGRSVDELEEVAREVTAHGGRSLVVRTDVRDPDSTEAMAAQVEAELGGPDVLVANSGVAGPTAALWDVTPEQWDETHAVNVRGPFLCSRAVLPGMLRRRAGSIVIIGSMSGKRPLPNRTPYTSSKTALIGLVRTLAAETGPYGVRVNLVSPGPVTGPRFDQVLEGQSRLTGRTTEDLRREFAAESPLRRLVDPADVAAAVVYLAGEGARSITGEDLNVSAGIAMY
ncbi:MAG: SDR family oxidoreductase [Actinomycetota bacterium]|nr:SDR family oxidoreductase [Actinomycetota bacterium]